MGLLRRLAAHFKGNHPDWAPDVGTLLESAPDGMVIVSAEGKIVVVNAQAEILFGYSRHELVGQPVEIPIPSRHDSLYVKHRAAYVAQPRVRPMGTGLGLLGKRKNGTELPVEISLSPVQTARGLFVISAIRDITDRRHAEEQIKKLNAELGAALRRAEKLGTTGDMATSMAREIESAIGKLVRVLSQLERHSATDPAIRDLLTKAQDGVAEISRIATDAIALQQQHESWKRE